MLCTCSGDISSCSKLFFISFLGFEIRRTAIGVVIDLFLAIKATEPFSPAERASSATLYMSCGSLEEKMRRRNNTRLEVGVSAHRILQALYGVIGFHHGMSHRLKHSGSPGSSGGRSVYFDLPLSPPDPLVKMFGELFSRYFLLQLDVGS